MNIKRNIIAASIVGALSLAGAAHAGYNPVGVQNDIAYSDVINGGWSVVYRGDYGSSFDVSEVFDTLAAGSNVMLGAIADNMSSFDVLAWAHKEDILQWTDWNQTHQANGVEWYFNGNSIGFAGAGDTIYQQSADTVGSGQFGNDPNGLERDHMSWHSGGSDYSNLVVYGGWRSGTNTWLNSSTDWDRVILVQSPVPEPEAYATMLAGLGLLGLARRRTKKAI